MPLRVRSRVAGGVAYADTVFCPAGVTRLPTTPPAGGGRFTGTVDLAASTPGAHAVTFTALDPCVDPARTRFVIGVPAAATLPNIITPNGDELNEAFGLPAPLPTVSVYELTVVNRWGTRVYRTTYPAAPWTATDVAAGTYFYQLRFADCAGRATRYKGGGSGEVRWWAERRPGPARLGQRGVGAAAGGSISGSYPNSALPDGFSRLY